MGNMRNPQLKARMLGATPKVMTSAERIQFLAEVAGGVGHARDASVERVERNGEADGQRGVVEVLRLQQRALQALRDGEVAGRDIAGGKERRQHIHASPARPLALYHRRVSMTSFSGWAHRRAPRHPPGCSRRP